MDSFASTPADLWPVYVAERKRLLSNAACMALCARRYGPYSPNSGQGYRSARKAYQRSLATLRANWAPVCAALRLSGSINLNTEAEG